MDEENYVPHLNFSGLYNNLQELLTELPLPGSHKNASIEGIKDLTCEKVEKSLNIKEKISQLLGSDHDINQQDKHIRNRLLGQSIVSALRSTSLDEFNPLISNVFNQENQTNLRFVQIEDKLSPLLKEILFLDPGCFNDVPLSDKHLQYLKEKHNHCPNENNEALYLIDEPYSNSNLRYPHDINNASYVEGLGERVKKRKRRPTGNTHTNHYSGSHAGSAHADLSDDENSEKHLDLLISKKFKTSIPKESMGIKTTANSTSHSKQINKSKHKLRTEQQSDDESLIYGDDDEEESGESDNEGGEPDQSSYDEEGSDRDAENSNEPEHDSDTSDVSYDGTKDNLYQGKRTSAKERKGGKKGTRSFATKKPSHTLTKSSKLARGNKNNSRTDKKAAAHQKSSKPHEKKSYLETVKQHKQTTNISVTKRTSRKYKQPHRNNQILSDDDDNGTNEVVPAVKSEMAEYDDSASEPSIKSEEPTSSSSPSENDEDHPGTQPKTAFKKKHKKLPQFKDTLSKEEIMETPLFIKFDTLLDKIIDQSEESDLPSLFFKKNKESNVDDELDIPLDSLIPKSLHTVLVNEAAKIKALNYTNVLNTEKIVKMFTIFLWNIKDGMKVLPLMQQGNERDEEAKLWEEIAWERVIRSANCSLTTLSLLTSNSISKKLFMEDLIEIIIQFTKYHLVNTIYPEFDPVYKINKTKDFYIKSKRHKSHQVESKHTLTLYAKINEIINMLAELVEVQTLTDSSIILISSLGTQPFFVENISDLQLNALRLITSIFSRYDKHRQLILEDILSSLARLPVSKRNLRSYKINNEESIQMVSALVLQLIHCIVDFPSLNHFKTDINPAALHNLANNGPNKEIKNLPDHDVLTLNSYDNAAKTAHTFLAVFLKKCSVRTCEEDFRTLFDHFVDDLLVTVNKPEWPASELLLTILGRILVQNFSDRKVEISLRLASLEYLGKITSRLRRDSLTSQTDAQILKEILEQIRAANEDSVDYNQFDKEPETLKLQRLLLNYLQENSVNDPFLRFARKFIIIQWYCDILLKANRNAVEAANNEGGNEGQANRKSRQSSENGNEINDEVSIKVNIHSHDEGTTSNEEFSNESGEDQTYDPRHKSNLIKLGAATRKKKHKHKTLVDDTKKDYVQSNSTEENLTTPTKKTVSSNNSSTRKRSTNSNSGVPIDENSLEFMEHHKRFLISFVHPGLSHHLQQVKDEHHLDIYAAQNLSNSNTHNNPSLYSNIDLQTSLKATTLLDEDLNSNTINASSNFLDNLAGSTKIPIFCKDIKMIHLDTEQSTFIAKYLASKRFFCRNYDIYLIQIMKVVHESAIAIRTKAMKCLANIIEADPGILAQASIQSTIHLRLMDQSPSVREAAVELIGKCILAKSELIPQYFNMIAERILDTGVSVRKRVIRILRDICNDFPEYQNITSICCKLVRRIHDEEGIKKLVIEVFQAMWFNPDFTTTMIEKKLANITETVNYFMEHGPELIETLFENLLANSEDPNCQITSKASSKIVTALIDKIMRIDENKDESQQSQSHRLVSCLSTLYLFTKIDAEFTVKHCDTLQPYLVQKCNIQGDCMIIHYVAKIFRLTVPKMGHPNPIFLSHLEESLMRLIVTQGMLVLESCVACLADIIKNVTYNYGLVTDCFLRFFGILYKLALETYENENSSLLTSKKPFILRSLYTVGLLCMHFDFDNENMKLNKKMFQEKLLFWENQYYSSLKPINLNSDKACDDNNICQDIERKKIPFLNTSNLIPVSECVFEIFYHFVSQKDEIIKHKALTGLGFFCINYARYLSHTKTKELYQLFLNDVNISVTLKYQVLKNIYSYLQEEENKATVANKEWEKHKKEDDFKEIGEISSSLSSAIVQIYLKDLLERGLDAHTNVRVGASNVLATIIKQGLIYPVQCIPYLIAMATDPQSVIRNKAHKILTDIDIKYPGFISMKALAGARKSYELHKILHQYEMLHKSASDQKTNKGNTGSIENAPSYDARNTTPTKRHNIRSRSSKISEKVKISTTSGDNSNNNDINKALAADLVRGFVYYSCNASLSAAPPIAGGNPATPSGSNNNNTNISQQNSPSSSTLTTSTNLNSSITSSSNTTNTTNAIPLATTSANQPLATIGFLYTILRNSKSQRRFFIDSLLKLFDEQSKVPLGELLYIADNLAYFPYVNQEEPLFVLHQMEIMTSVTGSNLLQAFSECFGLDSSSHTRSSHNFMPEEYEDEDNIDKLLASVPDHPTALYECCVASQGYFLLLYLRQFLKNMYSLTDNKLSNYSPMDTSKVFDKPISGNVRKPLMGIFAPQSTLEYLDDNRNNTSPISRRMHHPDELAYTMQEKLNLIRQYLEFKEMMLKLDPNEEDDEDVKAIKASREAKAQQKLSAVKHRSKEKHDPEVSYTIQQINSNETPHAIPKVHIRLNKPIVGASPQQSQPPHPQAHHPSTPANNTGPGYDHGAANATNLFNNFGASSNYNATEVPLVLQNKHHHQSTSRHAPQGTPMGSNSNLTSDIHSFNPNNLVIKNFKPVPMPGGGPNPNMNLPNHYIHNINMNTNNIIGNGGVGINISSNNNNLINLAATVNNIFDITNPTALKHGPAKQHSHTFKVAQQPPIILGNTHKQHRSGNVHDNFNNNINNIDTDVKSTNITKSMAYNINNLIAATGGTNNIPQAMLNNHHHIPPAHKNNAPNPTIVQQAHHPDTVFIPLGTPRLNSSALLANKTGLKNTSTKGITNPNQQQQINNVPNANNPAAGQPGFSYNLYESFYSGNG